MTSLTSLSLPSVLRMNALSCLGFGSFSASQPETVSRFLGIGDPTYFPWITAVGVILIGFALHLLISARRPRPIRSEILYFSLADGLWVAATAVILVFTDLVQSPAGVASLCAVATMVGLFSVLQWRHGQKAA